MSKFKKGNKKPFQYAFKGIRIALKGERNIKIHCLVAILATLFGIILRFTPIEFAIVAISIAIVLITEMLNSAIEFSLDAVFHNKYSKMVGMAKDIAAGSVMIASISSLIVGILLYGGKILTYF